MSISNKTAQFLTWAVALSLATWIIGQMPLGAALTLIATLAPWQWLAWLALNALIIALLSYRWLVLTRTLNSPIGLLSLLRVRQAGQLVSFVTPGPQFGGEPFQVYWLWKKYSFPGFIALLAVGLDRFYEFWTNFAVLLIAVLILITTASIGGVDWQIVAAILTGLIIMMSLLAWMLLNRPVRVSQLVNRITAPWQEHKKLKAAGAHWSRLHETLQQVVAGHKPALAYSLLVSMLAWAGMLIEFWLLLEFVEVPVAIPGFVFLFVVMRLAFLMPLPGGIGSLEVALFWAFQTLALPLSAASALIVLMRLRDVLILLMGAAFVPGLQKMPEQGLSQT